MRSYEQHWQPGTILYKEDDSKILIKFFGKKSNQIFLTKDLYSNKLASYNFKTKKLIYTVSLLFWCFKLEHDLQFKSKSINLTQNNNYIDFYLRKKRILFFLKLKSRNKMISRKLNKNINKINNENLNLNYLKLKQNHNLYKFLLKKLILLHIYKIYTIQFKLKLLLFLFLNKSKISQNCNKKKSKIYFYTNKSFYLPISHTGLRENTLIKAQKRMLNLSERINYYTFIQSKIYNTNNIIYKILLKKNLYKNDKLYNNYSFNWFLLNNHFNRTIKLKI